MVKTNVDLYRALIGARFNGVRIKSGVYPGDGILDPQWKEETFFSKRLNRKVERPADVDVDWHAAGGPKVETGGGTSLHDVAGWFPSKEFVIPAGTEYSDEIFIRPAKHVEMNPAQTVTGRHYQLEPRTLMTVAAFNGMLDNMARAAVVRQVALAKGVP